ncbi:MAG TPA: DUF2231 domain-containing protein [Pseudonocardiaceae bacterium]|jgi:hypothetical protein|nr:DUF2231 domain-containing protein [Pseudonocardiaceae bacterium]
MPLSSTTVAGLPAHPLLVDAVAVLLPLAALCSVALALHGGLRRRFGWPVLALTAVAVIAVPVAQQTGRQLRDQLASRGADSALVERHAALGGQLLPYALGFGVAVVVLFVAGRLADRERTAADRRGGPGAAAPETGTVSGLWRRIAVLASVLVVGMAAVTTVQVVRIGTEGAQAVWQKLGD